jgi:hypothetical protein
VQILVAAERHAALLHLHLAHLQVTDLDRVLGRDEAVLGLRAVMSRRRWEPIIAVVVVRASGRHRSAEWRTNREEVVVINDSR